MTVSELNAEVLIKSCLGMTGVHSAGHRADLESV